MLGEAEGQSSCSGLDSVESLSVLHSVPQEEPQDLSRNLSTAPSPAKGELLTTCYLPDPVLCNQQDRRPLLLPVRALVPSPRPVAVQELP